MPHLHLPKNWKDKATRALSKLNKPSVAAVCLWCGHQYRRGEYNPESESAHLAECPEYPQDAKRELREHE